MKDLFGIEFCFSLRVSSAIFCDKKFYWAFNCVFFSLCWLRESLNYNKNNNCVLWLRLDVYNDIIILPFGTTVYSIHSFFDFDFILLMTYDSCCCLWKAHQRQIDTRSTDNFQQHQKVIKKHCASQKNFTHFVSLIWIQLSDGSKH